MLVVWDQRLQNLFFSLTLGQAAENLQTMIENYFAAKIESSAETGSLVGVGNLAGDSSDAIESLVEDAIESLGIPVGVGMLDGNLLG